jgi:transposase
MYSLIVTAKLYDVDPRAWLADHPVRRLHELLPWNWRERTTEAAAARAISPRH